MRLTQPLGKAVFISTNLSVAVGNLRSRRLRYSFFVTKKLSTELRLYDSINTRECLPINY
ncbi:MAG: hypothetical protein LBP59_08425 [Planctomycetaceae bacterium]|nr:hypothetical protein [Planctomycetaceae bacterium]